MFAFTEHTKGGVIGDNSKTTKHPFAASSTVTVSKSATFTRSSAWCPGSTTRWYSSPSLCSSVSSSRTRSVLKCSLLQMPISQMCSHLGESSKVNHCKFTPSHSVGMAADQTNLLFLQISVFSSFWSYRPF